MLSLSEGTIMSIGTILLILLILMLLGVLPTCTQPELGLFSSGGLGLLVIILLILV
jgi:hypothetical protein